MVDNMPFAELVSHYEQGLPLYNAFTVKVENLVSELLRENDLRVHSVVSRVKGKSELIEKLERRETTYRVVDDVTDICGIRVITYFPDDVDAVSEVVEREFDIDWRNSVDKRAALDPDRFGYLSVHYVASLPKARLQLTEYSRFADCKCEIQIRSILQHTWAEIEHDLGYKSKQSVPMDFRRRFSRLAGLLEIADAEFASIRDGLSEYARTVADLVTSTPESVSIDRDSVQAYVQTSELVTELDARITSSIGHVVKEGEALGEWLIEELHAAGFETISDVHSALEQRREAVSQFATLWLGRDDMGNEDITELRKGISLFYLCYVVVAESGSVRNAHEYLIVTRIAEDEDQETIAQQLIDTYSQLANT